MPDKRQSISGYLKAGDNKSDIVVDKHYVHIGRETIENTFKGQPLKFGWGAEDVACAVASIMTLATKTPIFFDIEE